MALQVDNVENGRISVKVSGTKLIRVTEFFSALAIGIVLGLAFKFFYGKVFHGRIVVEPKLAIVKTHNRVPNEAIFKLTNKGFKSVTLYGITGLCGCEWRIDGLRTIRPDETRKLIVTLRPKLMISHDHKAFQIHTGPSQDDVVSAAINVDYPDMKQDGTIR